LEFHGNEGKWVEISRGTSHAINENANDIKVTARGNEIFAYINNATIIAGIKDDTFSSGKVKLGVALNDGVKVTLGITNFRVSIFP
jgi:hypothetical protein